jgi:hypothetical protein
LLALPVEVLALLALPVEVLASLALPVEVLASLALPVEEREPRRRQRLLVDCPIPTRRHPG